MKPELKITVLNDNRPGRKLLAEHGLSYLIEAFGIRILLDTGASDVYMKNAKSLGIRLDNLDAVVLSHGHWDHGDGLAFMKGQKLITHPESFKKRFHKYRDKSYVGLSMDQNSAQQNFDLQLSKQAVFISKKIIFMGEIPRKNTFEAKTSAFVDENGNDDFIPDDSGIIIKTSKGLVIVSGCAHAGICNTIDYAKQLANTTKVHAVLGGFHLKKSDALTENTIAHIKQLNIEHVIPSHCTDLPALAKFYDAFACKQVATGDVMEF